MRPSAIAWGVELVRIVLASAYESDARTARSRGVSPVLPALAAIRHAGQAAVLLVAGPRWAHRVGRSADALHAATMGLLWMASPSHARLAGRQFVGGLLMMQLESLAAPARKARR